MKKILIIRSSNMTTIDKLIDYINKKYTDEQLQLYILIQNSLIPSFNQKYPTIHCIEKEDGFFCYKDFKINNRLILKSKEFAFNEIYIPSSCTSFDGFEDIFLIASLIKTEGYVLFNSFQKIQNIKLNNIFLLLNKYYGNGIYLFKVFIAIIMMFCCYITYYSYYKIKNILKYNYRKFLFGEY